MVLLGSLDALLCVLLGGLACATLVVRSNERKARTFALGVTFFLWVSSFLPVLGECNDWQHLFWMVQVPMMGLFLISGALLFTTWSGESDLPEERMGGLLEKLVTPRRAPWWFFAMMASLGFAPLFLIALFRGTPDGRNIGAPIRRLIELAYWGMGGALPDYLRSMPSDVRGVGFLPREVTVPMGALVVAAWLWIAFCALALAGRIIPWPRVRRGFLLLAPLVLGAISMFSAHRVSGPSSWFDPRFFWPGSSEHSGIWRSDPPVMKSLGPLLLAAVLCALLLAIVQRTTARREKR